MTSGTLDGDLHRLGNYVRAMADEMGLRDWYLHIPADQPTDMTHGAECDVTYGQKVATITFRDDWPTWGADRLRSLVTHELIHCHTWEMEQRIADLRDTLGGPTYELYSLGFRHAHERAVDGIARAWAETLPLPIEATEEDHE